MMGIWWGYMGIIWDYIYIYTHVSIISWIVRMVIAIVSRHSFNLWIAQGKYCTGWYMCNSSVISSLHPLTSPSVDGCEILYQLVDGGNPPIIQLFPVFLICQRILIVSPYILMISSLHLVISPSYSQLIIYTYWSSLHGGSINGGSDRWFILENSCINGWWS